MRWLFASLRPSLRTCAAALCAIGVLHILATFVAPQVTTGQAYGRLTAGAPVHQMTVLPPLTPATQKVAFMSADSFYAVCPFDTRKSSVAVVARLPAPGWTLGLFSPEGENFYLAVAQPERPLDVALLLVANDDRFTGLTPQARGQMPRNAAQLKVPADRGFVLVRAPDTGFAYRQQTLAQLKSAKCAVSTSN
jgi:uncharacterized membrane protein